MAIYKEKEVCEALNLPSIPKREWDGEKSFKTGVAVVTLDKNNERFAYAVATFDNERDEKPRIVKVFGNEQFFGIDKIFIVPDYMDNDIENMDLDDASKDAAQRLLEQAEELENEGVESIDDAKMPENEYFFDFINSDEEGRAYIKDYNKRNKVRGKLPDTHDAIVMRLSVIYNEQQNKNKKR